MDDGFQVELSGYFSAEITWDFLKGRLDGDKRYKVSLVQLIVLVLFAG